MRSTIHVPHKVSRRICAAVATVAVAAAISGLCAASTNAGSGGGWIVFWGGPGPSIYAVEPDGSRLRKLTRFNGNAKRGDISRNGTRVLFDGAPVSGSRPGDFDVQTMNLDGSDRRTVAGSPARETEGRFSPDGTRVVYSRDSALTGRSSLWITTVNGTTHRLVTTGSSARWSPGSKRIFFARSDGAQNDLYVASADGARVTRLTRTLESEEPAGWSPDGRTLLFTRFGESADVYVMNVDGTSVKRLTRSPANEVAGNWSPDGSRIAFTKQVGGGREVFSMAANGSDARRVLAGNLDPDVTTWTQTLAAYAPA